jgi:hypothetical protein
LIFLLESFHLLGFHNHFKALVVWIELTPDCVLCFGAATPVHPKNWYPIPLIFCKPWGILPNDVPCHPKLADFANCMKKKGRGMSIFASIVEGDYKNKAEESRQVLYASLLYMFMMEYLILVPSTV